MAESLSGLETFNHLVSNVFLPLRLPQSELEEGPSQQVDLLIASSIVRSIHQYKAEDSIRNGAMWNRVARMVGSIVSHLKVPISKTSLAHNMINLKVDDVLPLYIRAQNAAVIMRKGQASTTFEIFEVQVPAEDVMSNPGKLLLQYPGPAVEIPKSIANDPAFIAEIANFLAQSDATSFEGSVATTRKAGSTVRETRDTTDPNYFTQLFLGILGGMGTVSVPPRITKRIADEVLWKDARNPWRRSPIWLIIRVALQTSLDSTLRYKHFMAYHHAQLITQCLDQFQYDFASEVLFMMRAKMARRLLKIQDSAPDFVVEVAQDAAEQVQEVIGKRWRDVQEAQAKSPAWNPSAYDIDTATNITLPQSRASLERIFQGRSGKIQQSSFTPKDAPRLDNVKDLGKYADGALDRTFAAHKHIALFDFEAFVYDRLAAWVEENTSNAESACRTIYSCFQQYLSAARSHYTVDIADQSIMILTLMRLWVGIDRLATSACNLLLQFSPEIPANILEPLLLRSTQHLEHARLIQLHILQRAKGARSNNSSVFSNKTNSSCFAVQYFRQSSTLQELKSNIEALAEVDRTAKIKEMEEKNEESTRLALEAARMEHEYIPVEDSEDESEDEDLRPTVHSRSCQRCELERRRQSMRITPHEWPLPKNTEQAEVVTFELRRPDWFTIWRDVTYQILWDLATESNDKSTLSIKGTLQGYTGLQRWHNSSSAISARIVLASCTKSFNRSHYSKVPLPASKGSVCVNNGLNFQMYDQNNKISAAGPFAGPSFARYGTLKVPKSSLYAHLNYAIEGTTHTSNQILADQTDCPKNLSLHEHIAFGTLRSGPRLQWLNILRGLEEGILTFGSPEVNLLHTQAAWQIGPLSEDLAVREWHIELQEPSFVGLLVTQCVILLERVRGNWLEANALSTIVLLITRALSSSGNTNAEDAYNLLRTVRQVTFKWLSELRAKLHEAETKSNVIDYQYLICEIATTCRSTFNVAPVHMPNVLKTQEDFTALISSAIILHDNQPPDLRTVREDLEVLLSRERRFAHQVAPYIQSFLSGDKGVFSKPLSYIWPGYEPGPNGWESLAGANKHWVSTATMAGEGVESQVIHFNLLNGRLLIDGTPLGRLPRSYYEDPAYVRLFGERALHIVPANIEGMEFATRDAIQGYQVLFALDKFTKQIIIQARKSGQTLQLVPHSQISADLPEILSTDYHHWANFQAKTIELRPLAHPWSQDSCEWLIRFCGSGKTVMENSKTGSVLIDIHSTLFRSISAQLAPLESSRYLHVSQSGQSEVNVALPRMKLQFFVNQDMQIESHNFRGQVIDVNQSAGTLFGLQNQLILRAKQAGERPKHRSRNILIPHGDVSVANHRYHVLVTIKSGSSRSIPFHRYQLDADLGYLKSDTGLTSRLFKIYLHALTSHCLPDRLTGRTGTEEALYELAEPASSSFEQLNKEEATLLGLIGSLTPKREYYPAHLTRMQNTSWRDMPALSQHYGFSTASADILRRTDAMQLFTPLKFKPSDHIVSTEGVLLRRAVQRAAPFYPVDTAAQKLPHLNNNSNLCNSDHSSVTHARLSLSWGLDSQSAAWAFRLLHRGQDHNRAVGNSFSLTALVESWGSLSGPRENLTLTYSPQWLGLRLPDVWITMYNLFRGASTSESFYGLCICIATVIFSRKLALKELPVLIAFATNSAFRELNPPPYSSFRIQEDAYSPLRSRIQRIVTSNPRMMAHTPAASLNRQPGENRKSFKARKQREYNQRVSEYCPALVNHYLSQWPSIRPAGPSDPTSGSSWFDVETCTSEVKNYFMSCARNVELRTHFQKIERVLSSGPGVEEPQVTGTVLLGDIDKQKLGHHVPRISSVEPSLTYLMGSRPGPECEDFTIIPLVSLSASKGAPVDTSHLSSLFHEFQNSENSLDRQYGHELDISREELSSKDSLILPSRAPPRHELAENHELCEAYLEEALLKLKTALGPTTPIEDLASTSGIWPRLTPRTILGCLSLKARTEYNMSTTWKNMFIIYARAIIEYQRSRRLVQLAKSGNTGEILKELDIEDDSNIDESMSDPDWLLVQIDGNFRARSLQRRVAREMISPSSSSNTVLQLNMGEGKSSVIVPIIAAVLADTKKLVRVIVLKPLWRQMFHLLVNRLSGLAHRRIYYLPFARNVQLDSSQARQLQELYAECMREGGILLAQPEHILSFKLMGIDHLVSSSPVKQNVSVHLRNTQQWLTANTRDILDESDEILHVRYQLVYTIGTQHPLENHPDRWTITQQLLQITASHILRLKHSASETLKYETTGKGRFPTIQIMPDCEQIIECQLINSIASEILDGRLLNLNFSRLPRQARQLVKKFLTDKNISYAEGEDLLRQCDGVMRQGILLLRGLLASGVLVFTLKNKRYRVDYGLDLTRSLLAVPFRAKDVPSLRAEFGHPDVAVLLTCLSYYYKGLTNDQLKHCFDLLYKLDNPLLEFEQWVRRGETVPNDLLHLKGVNTKDREQFKKRILPVFSHNSAVVDFFLSSVVFPKAAKEFPHKLATSGWDLVESKTHVTTGFSGTNDNRYLLPISITQSDPVQQLSTNALVLSYLLQPENNYYLCMRNEAGGETFTTEKFLKLLVAQQPEIRVLLDVGAQMLELQNEELVQFWLKLRPDVEAAVCFNDKDELIVVEQNGVQSPFYSSPYSQQLDKCIVYLDDGHTRGTDLKLPPHTRALVTLGPKVTKDRLLQGCMRMRKLGHGQSVVFAAPPEIDRQIRNSSPHARRPESNIGVLDILRWAMRETCKDLQHHVSNWAQQGLEHYRRVKAEARYASDKSAQALRASWITPESRSLEDMYGVQDPSSRAPAESFFSQVLEVPEFRQRLEVFGSIALHGSRIDEEQEREVSHEVERQQQIEYPNKKQPAKPELHRDVLNFVQTGRLAANVTGITSLFSPLNPPTPGMVGPWCDQLVASVDFSRTIMNNSLDSLSDYMRPVNWVLRGYGGVKLVLSPFEVNKLLPLIRQSRHVQLHVYAPRTSQLMKSFSNLKFYSIPHTQPNLPPTPALSCDQLQLDLFAGQLYLANYEEYLLLSAVLGIYNIFHDEHDQLDIQTQSDGFVTQEQRQQIAKYHPAYAECKFSSSPIPLLKELVGHRRKGMEYLRTHIGQYPYLASGGNTIEVARNEGHLLLSALLGLYNLPHKWDDHDSPDIQIQNDGFVALEVRQQPAERIPELSECGFVNSPTPILKELIGRRRKGMEYMRTHIGQFPDSWNMKLDDFDQAVKILPTEG